MNIFVSGSLIITNSIIFMLIGKIKKNEKQLKIKIKSIDNNSSTKT